MKTGYKTELQTWKNYVEDIDLPKKRMSEDTHTVK